MQCKLRLTGETKGTWKSSIIHLQSKTAQGNNAVNYVYERNCCEEAFGSGMAPTSVGGNTGLGIYLSQEGGAVSVPALPPPPLNTPSPFPVLLPIFPSPLHRQGQFP